MRDATPHVAFARREQALTWELPHSGSPCALCGVRPDVDCQHRPGVGRPPIALTEETPTDRRKVARDGQGLNFRAKRGGK